MTEARYQHTLSVADEALVLAQSFGFSAEDGNRLYLAALLHDITKSLSSEEHIALADVLAVPLTKDDIASPPVLHAITGAALAKHDFPDLVDDGILAAIRWHTTGKADMTLFEKLLYLADYIEPTRTAPICLARRRAFYHDLATRSDKVETLNIHLLAISEDTRSHIIAQNRPVHPLTDEIIHALKQELKH